MQITGVTATPVYAPRWLPYVDEQGEAFSGGEGRAGVDGRPDDQNERRRQPAGKESRGGIVVLRTDACDGGGAPVLGLGEVSTCWTPDGVEQCAVVTERLRRVVVGAVGLERCACCRDLCSSCVAYRRSPS
eukprot:SAG11_NODE_1863_length_4154_cov_3.719359_2_plen_131_part_00